MSLCRCVQNISLQWAAKMNVTTSGWNNLGIWFVALVITDWHLHLSHSHLYWCYPTSICTHNIQLSFVQRLCSTGITLSTFIIPALILHAFLYWHLSHCNLFYTYVFIYLYLLLCNLFYTYLSVNICSTVICPTWIIPLTFILTLLYMHWLHKRLLIVFWYLF